MLKNEKNHEKAEDKMKRNLKKACKLVSEYKDQCISTKEGHNGLVERDDTDKARQLRIGRSDVK